MAIDRREFLKAMTAAAAGFAAGCAPGAVGADDAAPAALPRDTYAGPIPTRAQRVWQDCEIGLIYHFDMPIAAREFAGNNATRRTFIGSTTPASIRSQYSSRSASYPKP